MNFTEILLSVDIILESGGVPLLLGESGIGKTALVKELGRVCGYHCITVEGNLLKEGEIGGLPVVEDYTVMMGGKEFIRKRTVYAVHTKLQQIDSAVMEGKEKVLLFIDEINRCEHTVQQELMNIILNREINGYILPDKVRIIAAMNPSSKYDDYIDTQYQVVDMDPAQENRFVWLEMESDVNEWLSWGKNNNIHENVLGFISTFPDYLHTPESKEIVKATPRSWERVSDVYKIYESRKASVPKKVFYNILKGNVGGSIAQEFFSYLENNKHPLVMPEEIFKSETISKEIVDRISLESHSRLYLTAKNALFYLKNKGNRKKELNIFAKLLQLYPSDLRLGVMREIKRDYSGTIYPELLEEEAFIEGYFSIHNQLEDLENGIDVKAFNEG